jgi:hypothetical protein
MPTAEFGMISAETVSGKKIAKFVIVMRIFTCRSTFLYGWVKYWLGMMSTGTNIVKSFAKFYKL